MTTQQLVKISGDMIVPEDKVVIKGEEWEVQDTASFDGGQILRVRRHRMTANIKVFGSMKYTIVSRG